MTELTCFANRPIEFVDDADRVVQLPADVTRYTATLTRLSGPDRADILAVTKVFQIGGEAFHCRTHISASDFFPSASVTGMCHTFAKMKESFDPIVRYLVPLVEDVVVFSDSRDDSFITVSESAHGCPSLYRIRHKYYGADVAFFARVTPHGSDSTLWVRFNTHVPLESTGDSPPVDLGDHLWFPVPASRVLWTDAWGLPLAGPAGDDEPLEWEPLRLPTLPRLMRGAPSVARPTM